MQNYSVYILGHMHHWFDMVNPLSIYILLFYVLVCAELFCVYLGSYASLVWYGKPFIYLYPIIYVLVCAELFCV